ncbi:DNA-binding protein DnaJ [Legionella rubrilucens]|uniref:DNA-binding protein DnaJ n=1 Tax=Legionella rubrilucens TaxID=458 RepID=A0A0W0XQI0_9GAMM|nr:J domain-containing protein [Legionella rubrilucens]KTD46678.1 DNA-binding protein DnaJ [Legionella rubrilucens]
MSSTPEDAAPKAKNPTAERIKAATNFYEVLGVPPNASLEDINKAYKKAALLTHPDKYKEPDAEEVFKKLGEAYSVLKDAEKRHQYDLSSSDPAPDKKENKSEDKDQDKKDDLGKNAQSSTTPDTKKKDPDNTALPEQPKPKAEAEATPAKKPKVKDKNRAQELNDSLYDFMTPAAKKGEDKDPNQEWVDQLLRWVLEFNHQMTNKILGLFSSNPADVQTPTVQQPTGQDQPSRQEQGLPLLEAMSDTDVLTITDGSDLHLEDGNEPETPQIENSETAIVPFNPN